ncbi:hypothetical protein KR222_009309 [Zaprionus bogoriensis]|nr:hypothetical protein KR222_009309 [Zaprionus bogoriensis]
MKATFALALLLGCLTSLLADDTAQAFKILNSCMDENGISAQDLSDLKTGKTKPEDASNNVKCATQCVLVKLGFMDDNANVLSDKIVARFPEAKAKIQKALSVCGSVKGANPCDTAFQIMSCFEEHSDHLSL